MSNKRETVVNAQIMRESETEEQRQQERMSGRGRTTKKSRLKNYTFIINSIIFTQITLEVSIN